MEDILQKTAEALKAAGHPDRVEILVLLSREKKLSVKQIHESLRLSQPETSRHLTILKNASVLLCERKNGHSYYFLNNDYSFLKNIAAYALQRTKNSKNLEKEI